ncbi:MAG: S1-like domain-containing RNA-binding protein [Bacteroidetes bacterium]|nr:S1-like domain-containing RNA-binding protein [Bacteroidota bacterium]
MELGKINKLIAERLTPQGLYLVDAEGNEVLLPNSRMPKKPDLGSEMEAFIYRDSEERLIATLEKPFAQVGEIAGLEVMDAVPFGYFLNWGLDKQVLLPKKEVRHNLDIGDFVGVFLYVDTLSERITASARLERHFNHDIDDLNEQDGVICTVLQKEKLGFLVTFGDRFHGMIYHNEIFSVLQPGQKIKAYIRKLREDGKVDLILQPEGMDHVEPSAQKILDRLKENGGELPFHDKSDPQLIQKEFGMSKKTFKKAVGTLYRKKLISLKDQGIQLNSPDSAS